MLSVILQEESIQTSLLFIQIDKYETFSQNIFNRFCLVQVSIIQQFLLIKKAYRFYFSYKIKNLSCQIQLQRFNLLIVTSKLWECLIFTSMQKICLLEVTKTLVFRVEALSQTRLGYFGNSVQGITNQFPFMHTIVTCILMSLPFPVTFRHLAPWQKVLMRKSTKVKFLISPHQSSKLMQQSLTSQH